MLKFIHLLVLSVLFFHELKAVYVYSLQSGDWAQGSTWSGNAAPSCGDSIEISASHTVSISNHVNYTCGSKTVLVIRGLLYYSGGSKLVMPCDSRVYILGGGRIDSDGGGNSNRIDICNQVLWTGSSGPVMGPSCIPATLPGCSNVMPVELISFEATQCGAGICLEWTTATEKRNSHFEVERMDDDRFVQVGRIKSKADNGNSRKPIYYRFEDAGVNEPVTYYRLKQVDTDGTFSYSQIIVVRYQNIRPSVELFPNPSEGNVKVKLAGAISGIEVTLLDSGGAAVLTRASAGNSLEIDGLKQGIYYCIVRSDERTEALKVVVR